MNEVSDKQLLMNYAGRHDDAAFGEIVRRYRDLVYSAAQRQVNAADAAEVAQSVFIDLTNKAESVAARLSGESALAGWLHRATRFAALKHLRTAHRRAANETQAMQELVSHNDDETDWAQIHPVLDEAIDSLADADREALLLRFFKNLDFRAVGSALGVSDDTAQKRVSRALERLRGFFAGRGITVSVSGLALVLSSKAVQAAPVGFAVSLAAATKSAAVLGATLTTTKDVVTMTTLQKGLIATSIAIAAVVGVKVYQRSKPPAPVEQTAQAPAEPVPVSDKGSASDQVRQLNGQIESLTSALEHARKSNAQTIAERDEARRAAAIYKELATRKEKNTDGDLPLSSHRDFMQGIGQIAANFALLKQTDRSKLSPQEKLALEDEQLKTTIDVLKLVRTAKANGYMIDDPSAEANLNQPDNTACFLYGALNLNEEQFSKVYSLISQFNTPALPVVPESDPITADRMVIVKQRRAELDRQIEPLLGPEQLTTFKAIQSDLHIINPYDGSVTLGYSWPQK
jgi:RNA polymerase sigma factor (sigma-70 family)